MKLSIIIPVYNEERTLKAITEKVENSLTSLPGQITDHEIILIEDGSTDQSKNLIQADYENKKNYVVHYQEKNMGKGAAITAGFSISTGDIVLIQDADLEYDPQDYHKLLSPFFENNADVVYGSRFKGEVVRVLYFWHMIGNKVLTLLSNMATNLNLTDMETCYKVFNGNLIRNMLLTSKRFGIEPEMTAKLAKMPGVRIYEVPISYDGRSYQEGKKIGWKDGVSAFWCIFKFNFFTNEKESFRNYHQLAQEFSD